MSESMNENVRATGSKLVVQASGEGAHLPVRVITRHSRLETGVRLPAKPGRIRALHRGS